VARKADFLQVCQSLIVKVFLHPGDALVVDIGEAHDVGRRAARRIETPLFGAEAYAGNAKPENFGLLLRRELALQPDKASPALELMIGLFVIDFGQDRGKLLRSEERRVGKECRPRW